MTVADLEGQVVIARAVGWDSPGSSEWALDRSDMPRMTRLIGPLIVNYVDDLDYTQFVVNGIPVDPATVSAASLPGQVLISSAAGTCPDCGLPEYPAEFKQLDVGRVPRADDGKWCKGAGCNSGVGIQSTDDPVKFAKAPPDLRVAAPDEWFASDDEWAAAKDLANEKARNVPKPSKEVIAKNKEQARRAKEEGKRAGGELRGNSYTRRARGEALFEEFGGLKKKFVPCTHCGIKTSPGGRGGFAPMEQDKILTLNEGGGYGTPRNFPNLIPSCSGCNKSRGESPYPVRPSWSGTGMSVLRSGFRLTEAEATDRVDDEVVAFPMYWNEPWYDGPNAPVQGILGKRDLDMFWGRYTQWIVGGVVVDPAHIYDVDDPLIASGSAMCMDCGGWLVASGAVKAVPRAPDGKWCKGTQCQGQMQIGGLEGPMEGPVLSPGQKAAWTKKQNKLKAEAAAAEAGAAQKMIDDEAINTIAQNKPLPPGTHKDVSDAVVDDYLKANVSESKIPASMDEKRALMSSINNQHEVDAENLKTQMGYTVAQSPRESRRSMLRETGQRRPTGGPNSSGQRVVYTDEQVAGMSKEKKVQLIVHHRGGQVTEEEIGNLNESTVTTMAVGRNQAYNKQVAQLKADGYDESQIPHSAHSTSSMQGGFATGMPKSTTTVAAPPITTAPGTVGKPANWDSMSGGQKAAWTKKQKKLGNTVLDSGPPKPAEWDSWGPGQKAAWTKGQNIGGVKKSKPGQLGTHEVKTFNSGAQARIAWNNKMKATRLSGSSRTEQDTKNREFRKTLSSAEKQAVDWYAGSGYIPINGYLKRGEDPSSATVNAVGQMDAAALKGPLAPKQMIRGKHRGPLADLDYKVGDVYTEPGFGSFSVSKSIALNSLFGGTGDRRVVTKVVDTKGRKQIPGNRGEYEAIMPRGTQYRVLKIEDYIAPPSGGSGETMLRYIEVEIV